MKFLFFVAVMIFTLSACNSNGKQLKERLAGADSVAINYFKGDGAMDTVVVVKIISERAKVDDLINSITLKNKSKIDACGYDGSLHFFKRNKVIQDIDFRMGEGDCSQFTFMLNGKYYSTVVTNTAKEMLLNIKR